MGSSEPAADWEAGAGAGRGIGAGKRAGVSIAIDTMAFHQNDLIPRRLAEVVAAIRMHIRAGRCLGNRLVQFVGRSTRRLHVRLAILDETDDPRGPLRQLCAQAGFDVFEIDKYDLFLARCVRVGVAGARQIIRTGN
jgi:hypothetical protein